MVQVTVGAAAPKPYYVRLRFEKTGGLQFISHLDLLRTVQKMLVRIGAPLWYSEGFNPTPKMIFSSSMSIGQESVSEFLDVRLTHEVDLPEFLERLQAASTPELRFCEIYLPEHAFSEICFVRYALTFSLADVSEATLARCRAALDARPILVWKKSKGGDRDVDISPALVSAVWRLEGDDLLLELLLRVENGGFLNPDYFVTALKRDAGILASAEEEYRILRTHVYLVDMTVFR